MHGNCGDTTRGQPIFGKYLPKYLTKILFRLKAITRENAISGDAKSYAAYQRIRLPEFCSLDSNTKNHLKRNAIRDVTLRSRQNVWGRYSSTVKG
jgi:hypothetical protein